MNLEEPKLCSFVLVHGGFHGGWCWRFVAQASGGVSVAAPPAAMFNLTEKAHIEFAEAHLTPHPLGTYLSRLNLKHPVTNGCGRYVLGSDFVVKLNAIVYIANY